MNDRFERSHDAQARERYRTAIPPMEFGILPQNRVLRMKKIAVALSGGVDSSLAVLLLRDEGYDVVGVTLRVQKNADGASVCASDDDVEKARTVAHYLGIEHFVCDVCHDFKDIILSYAWNTYANGQTPSPCVRCNERIKFGILFDFAMSLGCDAMATGHYAQIVDYHGIKRIARGVDANKDQSYFLSGISNATVERVFFPLGGYTKSQVRDLADRYRLPSARTPDSQNVCITKPGQTFAETLCDLFGAKPKIGAFVYRGEKIAKHGGIHRYTVGQRHGLGNLIPTQKAYVKAITGSDVEITTTPDDLAARQFSATDAVWHADPDKADSLRAQIRYRSPDVPCSLKQNGDRLSIQCSIPVTAATPGQIVAFYDGYTVIGRAIITG